MNEIIERYKAEEQTTEFDIIRGGQYYDTYYLTDDELEHYYDGDTNNFIEAINATFEQKGE